MDTIFIIVCILIMWPMLFSVPVLYGSSSKKEKTSDTLIMTSIGLFVAFLAWVSFGYFLVFNLSSSLFEGFFSYVMALQRGDNELILEVVLQGCFFLYAAGMFIGTLIHKVEWKFFALFIPIWLLVVYVPSAFLLWNEQGFLNQIGALDFSGGLVVHLTAGTTSLILSRTFKEGVLEVPDRHSNMIINYIATTLICFGWFGFNLGPLGSASTFSGLIILNTILAISGGILGYLIIQKSSLTSEDVLTGMIVGLVTSTALVGYASPIMLFIVPLISGVVTCHLRKLTYFNDPVDSFVLNGIGGIIGTLGLILFANPLFTPAGQTGLLLGGHFTFALSQVFALLIIFALATIGAQISVTLTNLIYSRKKVVIYENQ
ncbi:hypothetical protein VXN63_05235 [Marinilactibacillus sp. XAAS-LB27]|uniref:hypothetical protein n=1 Tax=Marinilactibacillus sp. XAAS-LB27 TaxID=3114538 RepID=UPI002E17B769|nr:hypothetical protein [Marinilactibacillus sp. XAAS-LB27]